MQLYVANREIGYKDKLYFAADDGKPSYAGGTDAELWVTDGTEDGTQMLVVDLLEGDSSSVPRSKSTMACCTLWPKSMRILLS